MSRKHLQHLYFEWSDLDIASPDRRRSSEEQLYVISICNQLDKTVVLSAYFQNALRNAKVEVGSPPITYCRMVLKKEAKPGPYFDPEPFLYVDIPFDPRDLLSLPADGEQLGKLYLGWAEQALQKLEAINGFPVDLLRAACKEFKKNRYSLPFTAGQKMIPGTRIKGVIGVRVSPAGTQRHFTALYRNKPLFQKMISETDSVEFNFSSHFAGFERNGAVVTVVGGHMDPLTGKGAVPSVEIDLEESPETMAILAEKGLLH